MTIILTVKRKALGVKGNSKQKAQRASSLRPGLRAYGGQVAQRVKIFIVKRIMQKNLSLPTGRQACCVSVLNR